MSAFSQGMVREVPRGDQFGLDWGIASSTCPSGNTVAVALRPEARARFSTVEFQELLDEIHELLQGLEGVYPNLINQYLCIMGRTVSGFWLLNRPTLAEAMEVANATRRELSDVVATFTNHRIMLKELRDACDRRLRLSDEERIALSSRTPINEAAHAEWIQTPKQIPNWQIQSALGFDLPERTTPRELEDLGFADTDKNGDLLGLYLDIMPRSDDNLSPPDDDSCDTDSEGERNPQPGASSGDSGFAGFASYIRQCDHAIGRAYRARARTLLADPGENEHFSDNGSEEIDPKRRRAEVSGASPGPSGPREATSSSDPTGSSSTQRRSKTAESSSRVEY